MGWVVQSLRQDLKFKQLLRSPLTTQRPVNYATKATLRNAFKCFFFCTHFNRSLISRNSFGIMIVQVCRIGFLSLSSPLDSVQDSLIGDLDTHSVSESGFDFSDL